MTYILRKLKTLWFKRTLFFRSEYNRALPFGDCIVDRWEKAKLLGFGAGSSIYDNSLILGDVKVGQNTWIGPNTVLDGSDGLIIGDNCSISAGVQIYTHDTVRRSLCGGEAAIDKSPTSIGNNCYIGPNSIIAKGVCIGDNVVIGANSLVMKSIDSNKKAFGTPARIVGDSFNYQRVK